MNICMVDLFKLSTSLHKQRFMCIKHVELSLTRVKFVQCWGLGGLWFKLMFVNSTDCIYDIHLAVGRILRHVINRSSILVAVAVLFFMYAILLRAEKSESPWFSFLSLPEPHEVCACRLLYARH